MEIDKRIVFRHLYNKLVHVGEYLTIDSDANDVVLENKYLFSQLDNRDQELIISSLVLYEQDMGAAKKIVYNNEPVAFSHLIMATMAMADILCTSAVHRDFYDDADGDNFAVKFTPYFASLEALDGGDLDWLSKFAYLMIYEFDILLDQCVEGYEPFEGQGFDKFSAVIKDIYSKTKVLKVKGKKALAVANTTQRLIPSELVKMLDERVVGQVNLKRAVASHIANHYNAIAKDPDMKKQNLLVVGETGTGKTLTVSSIAKALNKPFKVVNVTEYSKEGYVGKSINTLYSELYTQFKDKAGECILFIDEFDKIAGDETFNNAIQDALLLLLEGGLAFPTENSRGTQYPPFETRGICVILGGSFMSTIDKKKKSQVGFEKTDDVVLSSLSHDDIIKAGIKKELVGRIGNIVQTEALDNEQLRKIITEPKGCIKDHYNKLFQMSGIEDEVTEVDIDAILDQNKLSKLGVRGLWATAELLFRDRLFI